jgi:hypothetical protein
MSRDTGTGAAFKNVVEGVLNSIAPKQNIEIQRGITVGVKPNGQPNRFDFSIHRESNHDIRGLVSCRSQSTSGSAEEKIPFEVVRMLQTMSLDSRYRRGWVILGGNGWSPGLLDFYVHDLDEFIPQMKNKITILRTDQLLSASIKV